MKDQAIKLFGKEIPLLLPQSKGLEDVEEEEEEQIDEEVEKDPPSAGNQTTTEGTDDNKPLKKPDKILPCPRCKSMDTKFCYYNNYNVNQPRHFCKSCQRYWTSGGTMRNVPVGAGRRKNKTVAAATATAVAVQVHHPPLPPHPPIPYLAGVPWPPYPLPPFYPNGLPMPIVPTPFWNCSFPNSWPIPSWSAPPPPYNPPSRKHSREWEGELIKDPEASIVIPKTLRIDDPDEAARSSIWTTLGIKNDSIKRGSLFKGFESKDSEKKKNEAVESAPETSPAMMANPAALCRSVRLQEGF